jgi:uncharacterized membrane protein
MIPAPTPRLTAARLQRWFLSGLLTLLPIWLTWIVFAFVFGLLSDLGKPFVGPLLAGVAALFPNALGWVDEGWVLTALSLVATLAFILGVGFFARRLVGQRALEAFEAVIGRIPLAKTIYGSARQLLDILQTKPGGGQRVVLIDFPHKDMKVVGFVTRTLFEEGTGRELAAVYVPTTPNPTSGYLEIVPVEHLVVTDWSVDQAMTFIISGGAVAPDTIPFSRPVRIEDAGFQGRFEDAQAAVAEPASPAPDDRPPAGPAA